MIVVAGVPITAPMDATESILQNIRLLESGTSPERAAALTALLDHCALRNWYVIDDQSYGGIDETSARIATAALSWRELDGWAVDFIEGVASHYADKPHDKTVLPTPNAISSNLQRVANRCDKVGLSARRLLTTIRCGWIRAIDEEAQIDTIEHFRRNPGERAWIALAIGNERDKFTTGARKRAVHVYFDLRETAEPHLLGLFVTAILADLPDAELQGVVDIALRSEPNWRPRVLHDIADSTTKSVVWKRAIEELIAMASNTSFSFAARYKSLLFAYQNVGRRHLAAKTKAHEWRVCFCPLDENTANTIALCEELRRRIAVACVDIPNETSSALRAELRRIGLLA